MIGLTYNHTYQEGKRKETYVVEISEFEDTVNRKHNRINIQLARAFEMTLGFTLEKVSETQTNQAMQDME